MTQSPSETRPPPDADRDPVELERLIEGGLLSEVLRRTRLADDTARGVGRRIVVVALLAWLPLAVLTAAEGRLLGGSVAVPFLHDVEAHVRFLVMIPLLLLAEVEVRHFVPTLVREFARRGLVPGDALPQFYSAVVSGFRLRSSVRVELALIAIVYGVFILIVWRYYGALFDDTWYASTTAEGSRLTLAGTWYYFVSLPIIQFLLLRWYLWVFIWARFLWKVSRIPLNLAPAHPDRAGGLGFLEATGHIFAMVAAAHGAMTAGPIASQIFFRSATLPEFADEIVMIVVVVECLIFGPLLFFTPQLLAAKKAGLFQYGRLAIRYVREFQGKWLDAKTPSAEPLVGSADIQSLADLRGAYGIVEDLRIAPVSYVGLIGLAVATLIPIAPLLLTMIPLNELAQKLFSIAF